MTPEEWGRLMRQARAHAGMHNHRVSVRAVKLPPAAAKRFGISWAYGIDCPARAHEYLRGH